MRCLSCQRNVSITHDEDDCPWCGYVPYEEIAAAAEGTTTVEVEDLRKLREVVYDAHVLLALAQAYKGYAIETPIKTPWAKNVARRVKAARDLSALSRAALTTTSPDK